MMDQKLPDDPIDAAELPAEQMSPSAGMENAIAAGADVSPAAGVDEDVDQEVDNATEDHANPV